ncbi:hypothetical protein JHK87_033637 [Glycine soja]|nr:hypothetical protein JHK87_033637 [Glycine soja]
MVVIQKPSTEVNNGAVLATDGVDVHRKMFVCMTTWVCSNTNTFDVIKESITGSMAASGSVAVELAEKLKI